MDLKQLRAFVTVADTGSITKASLLLHIVQPAVSRQLQMLEDDLGATLFRRGRNGVQLTEAGDAMVEYARRILNEIDRARAEIKPARGPVGGIVTIGLLPSTSDLLSGALMKLVARQYPGIRLRISVGYDGHLQKWLDAGEVDFALLYDQKPSPSIQVRALLEEGLWVVGPARLRLRRTRPVPLSWVAERMLILPSAPHGLRNLVEQAASIMGLQLKVVAETNALSVQKSLVAQGLGITVLPSIAVTEDVTRGDLSAAPLTEPPIVRKIVLAMPVARQTTAPVRCVVPMLVECMRGAVEHGSWPAARWVA